MTASPPNEELRLLADKLLDTGALSDTETVKLEALLEEPASLDWFMAVTQQESLLKEALAGKKTQQAANQVSSSNIVPWYSWRRVIPLALSACVAFGLGLLVQPGQETLSPMAQKKESAAKPARITSLVGVVWQDAAQAPGLLSGGVAPDAIELQAGLAEITYGNGVRITVEGPCNFSITGNNAGKLANGKLVAYVPPGAEGFHVDYGRGKIVDLGTEFAMDVDGIGSAEVGVFDGKIELHRPDQQILTFEKNQAFMLNSEGKVEPIPLDQEKFIRNVPSRDFRWAIEDGTIQFKADVSHLIWKPAKYRTVFKWMSGNGTMIISNVRLLLDGQKVAEANHSGTTSADRMRVEDNIFELNLPQENFQRGRWTVEVELSRARPDLQPPEGGLLGMMQFEEGLISNAKPDDFIGEWAYSYSGHRYKRIFKEDGTAVLMRDGVVLEKSFINGRWEIKDGLLLVHDDSVKFVSKHVLRDRNTLLFVDAPYENAKRVNIEEPASSPEK